MVRRRMIRFALPFILWIAGCGGDNSPRRLLSMTISPATASSTSSSSGVQFTVMGTYSKDPKMAVPPAVAWEIFPELLPKPAGITVDQNGFAQCQGFVGTAPVGAIAPFDPSNGLQGLRIGQAEDPNVFLIVSAKLTCS